MMEEKVNHILREAGRMFLKLGIRNVSMDDISRELGISKKTLYQHFSNKADLIENILSYYLEESRKVIRTVLASDKNAIDIMLDLSKMACINMKEFTPSITFELQKYYPEIFRKFIEQKRGDVSLWMSHNLQQGIREGIYREDLDVDLLAKLYIQNLEDLFDQDFLASVEFSFSRLFEARYENHIRAIVNARGLEYFEKRKAELDYDVDVLPVDKNEPKS